MPFGNSLNMPTMNMGIWIPMMMPYVSTQWNGIASHGDGGSAMSNVGYGSHHAHGAHHEVTQKQDREESDYFRQPVNANRQARRNLSRPTDFREI